MLINQAFFNAVYGISIIHLVFLLHSSFVEGYLRNYQTFNKNVSQTLDSLLANNRYDKRIRPDIGGPPTIVTVNLYIKSIGPVSEIEQQYTMDVYFRQTWYDRRLSFELPGLKEFSMSWLFLEKVWKPDTYFTNGKKSYLHRITSPNKFLRIRNDGFLTYSMRLTISATCHMYLRKFPMDTQRCPLHIGSYGYTSSDVLYNWQAGGVGLEPGMELAQFDLVTVVTKDKMFESRGPMEFSLIKATFVLKRNIGYFVLQMYVPCTLMVFCSWVNFWIDPDMVPARVQLSVTSVLAITTLGFVGRSALPKVPYPTALDWFIIICFIFVFAVLVEYAVINFIDTFTEEVKKILSDREKQKQAKEEEMKKELELADENQESVEQFSAVDACPERDVSEAAEQFQKICQSLCGGPKSSKSPRPSFSLPKIATRIRQSFSVPKIIIQSEPARSPDDLGVDVEEQIIGEGSVNVDVELVVGKPELDDLDEGNFEDIDEENEEVVNVGFFRQTFQCPFQLWREVRILPTEEEIQNKKGEKEKFTQIDIHSRKIFPVLFTLVMSVYVLMYTYVVVDNKLYVED